VTSVVVQGETGQTEELRGSEFISSLPMRELVALCDPPLPEPVRRAAGSLKYRDFLTEKAPASPLLLSRGQGARSAWHARLQPAGKWGILHIDGVAPGCWEQPRPWSNR
jgi:hypothetical protein